MSDTDIPGDCLGERTVTRCWNLVDACGNVSPTMCHTVTTEDTTPPVFDCALTGTCPQDETRPCNDFPPPVGLTATDSCDPSVSVIFNEVTSDPTATCDVTITRTYTATDDCGNTTTYSYVVTLKSDNTPPVWGAYDPIVTVDCSAGGSLLDCDETIPPITDNCLDCPIETYCSRRNGFRRLCR